MPASGFQVECFTVIKYFLVTCGLKNRAFERVVFSPPCLLGEHALFVNMNPSISDAVRKKPLFVIWLVSEAGGRVPKKQTI